MWSHPPNPSIFEKYTKRAFRSVSSVFDELALSSLNDPPNVADRDENPSNEFTSLKFSAKCPTLRAPPCPPTVRTPLKSMVFRVALVEYVMKTYNMANFRNNPMKIFLKYWKIAL